MNPIRLGEMWLGESRSRRCPETGWHMFPVPAKGTGWKAWPGAGRGAVLAQSRIARCQEAPALNRFMRYSLTYRRRPDIRLHEVLYRAWCHSSTERGRCQYNLEGRGESGGRRSTRSCTRRRAAEVGTAQPQMHNPF